MIAEVKALEVGETHTATIRLDGDTATKAALRGAKDRLYNRLRTAVTRLKESNLGREFTIETSEHRTKSQDLLISASITRVS